MAGKNQHVVPDGNGGWNVKGEGNSKATANFNTQADAINKAVQISKKINSLKCLFMDATAKSVSVILMVMTLSHQKANLYF